MDQTSGNNGEQASAPARPVLKLRVNSTVHKNPPAEPTVATPAVETPGPKIKLKIKSSLPPTPVNEPPPGSVLGPPPLPPPPAPAKTAVKAKATKTKSGRTMKPTAKKRAKDDALSEGDDAVRRPAPVKRIKLMKTPTTPGGQKAVKLKVKKTGHPPYHPPGEGYDSEQEDREVDPVIEEQFILRYEGGVEEDLDYLAQMVEQGRIGVPSSGGVHAKDKAPAQFDVKFLPGDRRAVVRIRNNLYAAVLLDLPTITESMKTWDKKNLMKSADVVQMLLIFAPIKSEVEARSAPFPRPTSEADFRWPHGLTPPMHDAAQRRFRKRLTKKEVKDKEAELARLLEADRTAASVRWELVTIGQDGKEQEEEQEFDEYGDGEDDAEGEEYDETGTQVGGAGRASRVSASVVSVKDEGDADGDAQPDAEGENNQDNDALEEELLGMIEEALTPQGEDGAAGADTPAGPEDGGQVSDEDEDEDNEDDGEDDDDDEDAQGEAAQKDDDDENIAEARRAVNKLEADLLVVTNSILRARVELQLKNARKTLNSMLAQQAGDEEDIEE